MIKDKKQWQQDAQYWSRETRMMDIRTSATNTNSTSNFPEITLKGHDPKLDQMIDELAAERTAVASKRVALLEYIRGRFEPKK